jgi:hypothetical protein
VINGRFSVVKISSAFQLSSLKYYHQTTLASLLAIASCLAHFLQTLQARRGNHPDVEVKSTLNVRLEELTFVD